jgi:hypothetical protein
MANLTLRGTVTIDKPGHAGLAWQVTREEFRHETRRESIGTMAATQAQREEMGLTLDAKRHGEGSHVVQPAPSMKKQPVSGCVSPGVKRRLGVECSARAPLARLVQRDLPFAHEAQNRSLAIHRLPNHRASHSLTQLTLAKWDCPLTPQLAKFQPQPKPFQATTIGPRTHCPTPHFKVHPPTLEKQGLCERSRRDRCNVRFASKLPSRRQRQRRRNACAEPSQ